MILSLIDINMKEIPTYRGRENHVLSKWSPFRLFLAQPVVGDNWKVGATVCSFS